MSFESKNSIHIAGSGISTGGCYDTVVINGSGRITGDMECISFTTNGSSSVEGTIRADRATINGSCRVKDQASGTHYEVNGNMAVESSMSVVKLKTSGTISVHGSLSAEEIESHGNIHVESNCEAERFKLEGAFNIRGLLNADLIEAVLEGNSSAKEIGGETIRIYGKKRERLSWFSRKIKYPKLMADTIEGDQVELEYTNASVVRGKSVVIGPGCEIGLVEVEGDYRVSEDAKVEEVRRIGSM